MTILAYKTKLCTLTTQLNFTGMALFLWKIKPKKIKQRGEQIYSFRFKFFFKMDHHENEPFSLTKEKLSNLGIF